MDNDRISIYGKDAEGNKKRACDMILIRGRPFMEMKDRYGHIIRAPADEAVSAIEKLKQLKT